MPRHFSSAVCAAALLIAGASTVALSTPAAAAVNVRIGFDFFHDRLTAHGRWIHHPIWGDVWRPRVRALGADWQPYSNGYWEYTDEYGWYWMSDDPFDDVVYHYGRWVYDGQWGGWLWLPGYTWAPAWVAWREGDDYTGWMPLPPDEAFISGSGAFFGLNLGPIGINFYDRWYRGRVDPSRFFVFVNNRHLAQRDYRRFVVPRDRIKIVFGRTRAAGKFEVVNNRVVNRGIDIRVVERASGRRIAPVSAKMVIKPNAVITTVDEAKEVRQRERTAHPMNMEAIKRNGGGDAGGKESNEPNAAPGAGEKPDRNRDDNAADKPNRSREDKAGGSADENGGMRGGGKAATESTDTGSSGTPTKKNGGSSEGRMSNPAGEGMSGPAEDAGNPPKKSRSTGSESRMSNPSDESMSGPGGGSGDTQKKRRPANPEGSMSGPGGGMTGPGNGAGTSGTSDSGGMSAPRQRTHPSGSMGGPAPDQGPGSAAPANPRRGSAGGMSGPQTGSSAASSGNSDQSGNAPKKRKRPTDPPEPSQQ